MPSRPARTRSARLARTVRATSVALLLATALASCSSGPEGAPDLADLGEADRAACTALLDALPASLGDLARDEGDDDVAGASYGDPAVTVACGVAQPPTFDRFSECQLTDGVGWYVPPDQIDDQPREITLTAVGFRPRVQVVVPADYWPTGGATAMVALGPVVRDTLELVDRCR